MKNKKIRTIFSCLFGLGFVGALSTCLVQTSMNYVTSSQKQLAKPSVNSQSDLLNVFMYSADGAKITDATMNYTIDPISRNITLESIGSGAVVPNPVLRKQVHIDNADYTVTSIKSECFKDATGLTGSISIPNSIEYIGANAFNGTGLTLAEDKCLYSNSGKSLTMWCLGYYPSANDATNTTFKMDVNTEAIAEKVFYGCTTIEGDLNLNPYNKLTKISASAFENCSNITGGLSIPKSVKEIGYHAFWGTSIQSSKASPDIIFSEPAKQGSSGNLWCIGYIKNPTSKTKVEFPTNVEEKENWYGIAANAFQQTNSNYELTGEIKFPSTLRVIGDNAFMDCKSVTGTLTINDKIETIGHSAFRNATNIEAIDLSNADGLLTIGRYTFNNCASKNAWDELKLPEHLITIGANAFEGSLFRKLNLDNSKKISYIGGSAFKDCKALAEIGHLPTILSEIKAETFSGCIALKGIDLNNLKVQRIEDKAFYDCTELAGELNFPNTLLYIGADAFGGTTNPDTSVYSGTTKINKMVFNAKKEPQFAPNWGPRLTADGTIDVPYDAKQNYINATNFGYDESIVSEMKSDPMSSTTIIQISIVASIILLGTLLPLIINEIIKRDNRKLLIADMDPESVKKTFTIKDKEEHAKIVAKEKKEEEEAKHQKLLNLTFSGKSKTKSIPTDNTFKFEEKKPAGSTKKIETEKKPTGNTKKIDTTSNKTKKIDTDKKDK